MVVGSASQLVGVRDFMEIMLKSSSMNATIWGYEIIHHEIIDYDFMACSKKSQAMMSQ